MSTDVGAPRLRAARPEGLLRSGNAVFRASDPGEVGNNYMASLTDRANITDHHLLRERLRLDDFWSVGGWCDRIDKLYAVRPALIQVNGHTIAQIPRRFNVLHIV